MPDGFHPPVEEYLEAIYSLEEDGVEVIRARLAERLAHSAPSVSEMVQRLHDEGYVEVRGRTISLTAKGRSRAESVVRKHRLAERLLVDIIGLPWSKVHSEAGRWEHVISDEVEERLVALLGSPGTCPHGNPIPGAGRPRTDLKPLSTVVEGDQVRVERVLETVEGDLDSLTWLDGNGLRPGSDALVETRAPDGTLTLAVDGRTVSLGPTLAARLFVSVA
jgi:DtxR family Mn-dependent transcriptional regulator